MSAGDHGRSPQEADVLPGRTILVVGAIGVIVTLLVVWWSGSLVVRTTPPPAPAHPSLFEEGPFSGSSAAARLQAQQREQLRRYGWVDRARGIARIPIGRAMDLVLAQPERMR